jgi:hypothetical protein
MEKSYPLTVAGAVADSALAFAQSLTAFPCCRSFDQHLNAAMMATTFEMSMRREALFI